MEHLFHLFSNCHGEWTWLGTFVLALPLAGPWIRARFDARKKKRKV